MNKTQLRHIEIASHLEIKRGIYQMIFSWQNEGERKRKSKSTGLLAKGNKKQAEKMLFLATQELEEQMASSIDEVSSYMLFADFMLFWLYHVIESRVELTTFNNYKSNVEKVIVPYFLKKELRLRDVSAKEINRFYEVQLKRVKPNSVIKYHNNIIASLKYAMEEELIPIFMLTKIKKPKENDFMPNYMKESDIVRLCNCVEGTKMELAIVLSSFYGLRRSEIVGLKWDAIDFDANRITIKHTVVPTKKKGKTIQLERDRTKGTASYRSLPLVSTIRERLLNLKTKQQEDQKRAGRAYISRYRDYIYLDELGDRILPNYISKTMPTLLKRNGFEHIRFHDLRHSCASLLLANGVSMKEIQEWLGHADFSTTANIYTHIDHKSKEETANAIDWINNIHMAQTNTNE